MNTKEMIKEINSLAITKNHNEEIVSFLNRVLELKTRIDLFNKRLENPRRYPRSRVIISLGVFSVWIRRKFKPYYRFMRKDLLECGMCGITLLITLPKR